MKSRRKYYLQQYSEQNYWHGGIGYTDMETILQRDGYLPVQLPLNHVPIFSFLIRCVTALRIILSARSGDEWVVIYPIYGRMNLWLINRLLSKKINLTVIVGDIDGLKDSNPTQLEKDIQFFKKQNSLIVHNQSMETWLRSKGYKGHTSPLQLFDFLAKPTSQQRTPSRSVAFAGNLNKSTFLFQLGQPELKNISFHVYGNGVNNDAVWPVNVQYEGAFSPRELPGIIEGSFGLLWDGEDWKTPSGPIGNYMPYISHHKLSLYVLAGLPILVPRTAGSAPFIEENNLGVVFNSISELETVINSVTEERYMQIRENLVHWAAKLSNGNQLREALQK